MGVRFHTFDERPPDTIPNAAVAIKSVDENQQHVGIFHRDDFTGELKLLHLAWHFELRNSNPNPGYGWVDPNLPKARAVQVAARCRQVLRANPKGLPYAFSSPNDCFDGDTGKYLFGPTRHGLTCATFVLAIFHSAGLPLVRYDTWPASRADDDTWRREVIKALQNDGATQEHINAIQSEPGAVRFRPQEVAGAAGNGKIPVAFGDAVEQGNQILAKLVPR